MQVPYVAPIIPSLTINPVVRIKASPHYNAKRFAVNLQCGPNTNPRDDVAFHFCPFFDRRVIVRNSIHCNSWGPEENLGSFPFTQGPFVLDIIYETNEYKVFVNGAYCLSFIHRIPPTRVSHVTVDGDITLQSVEFLPSARPDYGFSTGGGAAPHYAMGGVPPYPSSVPAYTGGPSPYPTTGGPAPYPTSVGGAPYSVNPPAYGGTYPQGNAPYPQQAPVYQQGNLYPPPGSGQHGGSSPKHSILKDGAAALGMGMLAGGALKKGSKLKKAQKKALKYGIPIAGLGVGAYALKKTHGLGMFKHHHHHHGSSSSSSSSSSSDSD